MSPTFQLQGAPIFIGAIANAFPNWLKSQAYSQILVLTDENTSHHCLPYFMEATGLGDNIVLAQVHSGEMQKNLSTCEKIWQVMLEAKLDRKALVINLGGGVIGDMGGFCAATWKRGVDFIQVPTTLLSMTDAAIGGKTGIDFQGLKNNIGVFQQPAAVFVDPFFLQTLPERELRSGYAEVIKHALIGDPALAQLLSPKSDAMLLETMDWLSILQKSIAVKVHVVAEDPLEKGLRMLLNFGHSIGHALESYFLETPEPLTHGEAIYIGMICEAELAGIPRALQSEVLQLGQQHFPTRMIPEEAFPALWNLMQQDKKNSSGTVRMAVPDEKPLSIKVIEPSQSAVEQRLKNYNAMQNAH